jgi:hypothetical protein
MTASISEGATGEKEKAGCKAASLKVISGSINGLYPLRISQQNSQNTKRSKFSNQHDSIN